MPRLTHRAHIILRDLKIARRRNDAYSIKALPPCRYDGMLKRYFANPNLQRGAAIADYAIIMVTLSMLMMTGLNIVTHQSASTLTRVETGLTNSSAS